MNYTVAFSNGYSRRGIEAKTAIEAMDKAEHDMPYSWQQAEVYACAAEVEEPVSPSSHYPILVETYRGYLIRRADDGNERYAVITPSEWLVHYSSYPMECRQWIDDWYNRQGKR